jgi:nucleoside diphosphate kinase
VTKEAQAFTNYLFIIKTYNMRFIKSLFTILILLTFSFSVYAQDPLGGRDLSNLKVDALSENQISAIQQRLKQSGLTIDQLQSQAIAKGMSTEEFSKLKDRVNGISGIAGIVMAKTLKKSTLSAQQSNSLTTSKDSTSQILNNNINSVNIIVYKIIYKSIIINF